MSLPTGLWKINVNGTEGNLTIDGAPNQQGIFSGGFFGVNFRGFWDESSQCITFCVRTGGDADFPTVALLKGYLFRSPPNPEPGRDVVTTLTGFVQVNDGPGFRAIPGTSRRNIFGWMAQISEVL